MAKGERGDHGPANPAFGETRQSRLMDVGGVSTLVAIFWAPRTNTGTNGHTSGRQLESPTNGPANPAFGEPHLHLKEPLERPPP